MNIRNYSSVSGVLSLPRITVRRPEGPECEKGTPCSSFRTTRIISCMELHFIRNSVGVSSVGEKQFQHVCTVGEY